MENIETTDSLGNEVARSAETIGHFEQRVQQELSQIVLEEFVLSDRGMLQEMDPATPLNDLVYKIGNNEGKIYVAKAGKELAGFIAVHIEEKPATDPGLYGYVSCLHVKDAFHGFVEQQLLEQAEHYVEERGISEIRRHPGIRL